MADSSNVAKLKGKRNDYKQVFSTEEGQRVLKDLEMVCMYRQTTFDKDALQMSFQEGLRAVYLHITSVMNIDIEELERIANQNQAPQ